MLTLHLTNGDSASAALARSGLPGDILSWRDLLHDGPVVDDGSAIDFARLRAEFLASRGWASRAAALKDFNERDERFASVTGSDAVVLWFEPDLYDQLQLIQILARLARRTPSDRPSITIAPADCFLGDLRPDAFVSLYAQRRTVVEADLAHALSAWQAFASTTPEALLAMTDQLDREITSRTYATDDAVRLPHLTAALRRQLEELPDVDAGLSRTERQLCEALGPGAMTLSKLFTANQAAESWKWLGDVSFAWYVERLSECVEPLVVHTNGSRVMAPLRDTDGRAFWDRSVQLTPFGLEAIRERNDMIQANGIDRWIGGTHCTPAHYWRWDGRQRHVVAFSRE